MSQRWDFTVKDAKALQQIKKLRPDHITYSPTKSPKSGTYRYKGRAFFNTDATSVENGSQSPPAARSNNGQRDR
jgi:hypothetical protein